MGEERRLRRKEDVHRGSDGSATAQVPKCPATMKGRRDRIPVWDAQGGKVRKGRSGGKNEEVRREDESSTLPGDPSQALRFGPVRLWMWWSRVFFGVSVGERATRGRAAGFLSRDAMVRAGGLLLLIGCSACAVSLAWKPLLGP